MDFEKNNTPESGEYIFTSFITPERQKEILKRMNELFERSGLTIQQLSQHTYIADTTLTRYFSGKTKNPHFYTMVTMIIAMGGDVNEILGITLPEQSDTAPAENPYGELLDSYREEARTLRSAVDTLTKNLDALTAKITGMSKVVAFRTIALFVVIAVFCVLEVVDICNPDWGRYQWAVEMFGTFLQRV